LNGWRRGLGIAFFACRTQNLRRRIAQSTVAHPPITLATIEPILVDVPDFEVLGMFISTVVESGSEGVVFVDWVLPVVLELADGVVVEFVLTGAGEIVSTGDNGELASAGGFPTQLMSATTWMRRYSL
jgi:hypothetical protein